MLSAGSQPSRMHGIAWIVQRVTAVFLVVVLALHFILLHYVNHPAEITFAGTRARMESVTYFLTMWLFLVTATVHGLNGAYQAVIGYGVSERTQWLARAVGVVAGIGLLIQGTWVALAMAGGFP